MKNNSTGTIVMSMIALGIAMSGPVLAAESEKEKIEAAIARVEKSGLVFIRNGTEHTSVEAGKHMRDKLKAAGNEVKTFNDFVEKVASKSSLTGRPYLLKMKDGKTQEVGAWLRATFPATQPATSQPAR